MSSKIRFSAVLVALGLTLAGCASTPATNESEASGVSMSDAWVKAAPEGMSAAFGTLTNKSDHDVTVVSVESPSSKSLELHETVSNDAGEMTMREVDGGFVIKAGKTLTLEPGGNHIMLMDIPSPLVAGDTTTFTLTFADDSTLKFDAPVKDYSGANETYDGGMDMPSPDEHEHSDH